MDEHRLAGLFGEAVRDMPPASFDERDVGIASRRITIRRRLLGGAFVLASALAFGFAVGLAGFWPGHGGASIASAPVTGSGIHRFDATSSPGSGHPRTPSDGMGFPIQPALRAPGSPGAATGCGPVDQELADALASEVPTDAATPMPVDLVCPPGARGASYRVRDGDRMGAISAVLLPRGAALPVTRGGAVLASASTRDGGRLVVVSEPRPGSSAPYADRIKSLADQLAARF